MNDWLLPYADKLQARPIEDIDLLVIHCTELPDLSIAREYGERELYESGTGNSGHYYIDRDGAVHRFIPNERIAHHVRGHNSRSIGIELVNTGRFPNWLDSRHQAMNEPYSDVQIQALIQLLHQLIRELPNLAFIAGHEDLDRDQVHATDDASRLVFRKRDPGEMFPWEKVLGEVALQRM
ncbi:MAG: N-acetylmuramoyl-L-alanine amidase [Lysobacteraceae bacterium]